MFPFTAFTASSQVAMIFAFVFECLLVLQIILTVRRVAFTLEAVNDSLQKFVPKNYDYTSGKYCFRVYQ